MARPRGYVTARPDRCTCDEALKGNDVSGPCEFLQHARCATCCRVVPGAAGERPICDRCHASFARWGHE